MVISSLYLISVEEVIRGLRWGIGPKRAEALSTHLITYGCSFRGATSGGGITDGRRTYGRMEDGWMDGRMDGTSICDEMKGPDAQ
jgi:hypothetical protein